ncbi:sigma-70 family RNA polymerase sigma factor [Leifsonia sp. 1010]|uniref:RNA polymerase sigma factor n=1 Tax=Leifsonia sp. 1010 TaxID=2817769 RepID=UPI0028599BC9|nr:sigma-70 family RNA polymerase sigma factor [Leifsonia sp. 1010]MDR6611735.1 RNA polymerase sigma-70 factor (ECF subfamily) [Leifsonia sp. 1010]
MPPTAVRPTDLELLHRVRRGEHAVFAELWTRYESWAHHVARRTTSRYDAEDIVQEAFTKVLAALRNGNGPTEGFAHYLRTAIRNVAATWGARDARMPLVPLGEEAHLPVYEFEVVDLGELEQPFRSLPERWRRILLLTCVHELPLSVAAEVLGMTPGAAAALAARARTGLRMAVTGVDGEDLTLAA